MLDITKIDFTKKENQTLRNWFALMWQNFYIFLFAVGLSFFIGMAISLTGTNLFWLGIPLASMGAISYFGFYQFWNDMKNGTSR